MAQPYLDELRQLVSNHDSVPEGVDCKHFFSGSAFYLHGKICGSLSPAGLAFKLHPDHADELISAGKAQQLKYFEKSPVKRGYILFADYKNLSGTMLSKYFDECFDFALGTGPR